MTIYLYVKQHSVTGLKYFGKTAKYDPHKYLGSGKYWLRHIKKHGNHLVETLSVYEFEDQEEATKFALEFSEKNQIVESTHWANLIPENGITGGGNIGMERFNEVISSKQINLDEIYTSSPKLIMTPKKKSICPVCHDSFDILAKNQKYCSSTCKDLNHYRRKGDIIPCAQCKTTFTPWSNRQKYCSRLCSNNSKLVSVV